jgi:hypothetical protein
MKSAIPLFLLCFALGCGSAKEPFAESTRTASMLPAASPQAPTESVQRRLVRTVDLDLRATDTTATSESLQKLATEFGGHIGSLTSERRSGLLVYSMTLRIPEARLDEALTRIKSLVDVDRETMTQEDVTEKYVDLAARMKTLEATESELRNLLSESRQRQQKADEIMVIYKQLTEIRSSIEQIRGQLNVIENLSALATIRINLLPKESPAVAISSWRPSETVRRSFQSLVSVLTGLVDFAIILCIVVLPPTLILALIGWLALKGWNAARARTRAGA